MRWVTPLRVCVMFFLAACSARGFSGGGGGGPVDAGVTPDGAPADVAPPDDRVAPPADLPVAPDVPTPGEDVPDLDAPPGDAPCVSTCAASTCAGGMLVDCVRAANGCLYALPARACPAGQSCTGGACQSACPAGGCPAGFTCTPEGYCRVSDVTRIALNLVTTTVSGQVLVNGASPTFTSTATCTATPNDRRAIVRFSETTRGYSFSFTTTGCSGAAPFTGSIYPGTYRVTVEGAGYSNVPSTDQLVEPELVIPAGGRGGVVLNVVTTTVSGDLTVNGAPPTFTSTSTCTATPNDRRATIRFSETTRDYSFSFPTTGCTGTAAFGGVIFPGTYRVTVEGTGYSNVPPTAQHVFDGVTIGPAGANGLHLNLVTTTVSGQVLVNGASPTFTSTATCTATPNDRRAIVRFSETTRGYSFSFTTTGCSGAAPFTGSIYPGTYRVAVEGSGYSNVPSTAQLVETELVVPNTGRGGVVLNVVTTTVSGDLTVNGAPPTFTSTSTCTATPNDRRATIRFSETARGYSFGFPTTGCTGTAAFGGVIFPGTYRVTVEGTGYSNVPATAQRVIDGVTIGPAGANGLHLNLVTTTVSGQVTVNGASPTFTSTATCTATPNDRRAIVRFAETTRGYSFSFTTTGCSGAAPFTGSIYPGTYRVTVEGSGYSDVPSTTYVAAESVVVPTTGLGGLRLDVMTRMVGGTLTVNDRPPVFTSTSTCTPTPNDRRATVRFSEVTRGYSFSFATTGCTGTAAFAGTVFPGVYRVSAAGSGYSDVPTASQVLLDRVEVP